MFDLCHLLIRIISLPKSFVLSSRHLKAVSRRSYLSQIIGLLDAVLFCGLWGSEYYLYRLDEVRDRSARQAFLSQWKFSSWAKRINQHLRGSISWSKVSFHTFCQKHQLPSLPVASVDELTEHGGVPNFCEADQTYDLCSKPDFGYFGEGVLRWQRHDGGYLLNGCSYTYDEVVMYLHKGYPGRHMVLQPWIENHCTLAPLTNGGLATIRFITFRNFAGKAIEFMAIFRMPCGGSIVDNFQQGNIVASINLITGELGAAYKKDNGVLTKIECHPDTGGCIVGQKLPYWDDVRSLCRRAQLCCDREPFVGWDVALTSTGPILLEANPTFGIEGLQAAHGVGIKNSTLVGRMVELMATV